MINKNGVSETAANLSATKLALLKRRQHASKL
jgi:hypothetical protein